MIILPSSSNSTSSEGSLSGATLGGAAGKVASGPRYCGVAPLPVSSSFASLRKWDFSSALADLSRTFWAVVRSATGVDRMLAICACTARILNVNVRFTSSGVGGAVSDASGSVAASAARSSFSAETTLCSESLLMTS